jgi:hypothetical protein
VDDRRYKSYLFISRVFESDIFNALEREVLIDAAEGMLLMRSPDPQEIEELELNVSAALEGMTASRRIHETTAAELKDRIRDCGPSPVPLIAA